MSSPAEAAAMNALSERVGDAERDQVLAELNGHHAHGRLSAEELERRQVLALNAVTRYDVLRLVADLPHSTHGSSQRIPDVHQPLPVAAVARRAGVAAATASPVIAAGWWMGYLNQYAQGVEVGFTATVVGGAVGYLTHAVRGRLRRRNAATGNTGTAVVASPRQTTT